MTQERDGDPPDQSTRVTAEGFHQLESIPSAEELEQYYANKYYQEGHGEYREQYDDLEQQYIRAMVERKVDALQRSVPELPVRGRILDVGCGEGHTLAHFHDLGWEIVGIDHSVDGVLRHHPRLKPYVTQSDIISHIKDLVACGRVFDIVWLDNVLEHARDPQTLLLQCRSISTEGGALIVEVPNDFSLVQRDLVRLGKIDDRAWVVAPDHISYFNRPALARLAASAGWEERTSIADFPIDWFLYHPGSNYYRSPEVGPDAHRARMHLEWLLAQQEPGTVFKFLQSMADVGFGRQILSIFVPSRDTRGL